MQFFKHSRKTNSKKVTGQGMSEYLIIVGLLAVAGIVAMGLMGSSIRTSLSGLAVELAGGDATDTRSAAEGIAGQASAAATERRSLSSYVGSNAELD